MTDTVSEDVKLDEAGVVAALDAFENAAGEWHYEPAGAEHVINYVPDRVEDFIGSVEAQVFHRFPQKAQALAFKRGKCLDAALRAYLAATKPPLADVTVKAEPVGYMTAAGIDNLRLGFSATLVAPVVRDELFNRPVFLASPPMPGRGEGFVLVPVELTDEMILARWPSYHPWGQNAPPPEDRPSMYAEMVEKTKALWAILIASRPQEDSHAK
jgi:hypothetical protein